MEKQIFDTEYHALFYDKDNELIDDLMYNDSCCYISDAVRRVYDMYEEDASQFDHAEVSVQVTEYEKEEGVLYALDTVAYQTLLTFKDGKFTEGV